MEVVYFLFILRNKKRKTTTKCPFLALNDQCLGSNRATFCALLSVEKTGYTKMIPIKGHYFV